ncbi:hypothetical protein IMZ48_38765 [Candidatus Bathyarchaeota archaeon]|nr:hypothetical protein [Candidatus Bathyarchaeota archaeon]
MPIATPKGHGIPAVAACATFLDDALLRAEKAKDTASIEPPLTKAELGDVSAQLSALFDEALGPLEKTGDAEGDAVKVEQRKVRTFAMFETAARETFTHLVVSAPVPARDL